MAEKYSADYRQGYLNGYQRAFENLVALLKLDKYDLDQAEEICRAFWINELSDWLANDGDLPALVIPTEANQEVSSTVEPFSGSRDPYQGKTSL
ncbi:MAG: hypothetical protein L6R45_15430 [Anaerolineae bacterium]|nr:hypothetical protein [Anaerolineae bacterium]